MAFRHALFVFFSQGVQQYSPTECTEPTESLGGAAVSAAPTEQRCTVHGTHLGGYGIPAIPTPPSEILPRNSRNSQKLLAEKSLPQMCIDAHRWLGCVGFSHGIHGIHRSFWRRRASHRWHRCSQMVRLRRVLPRNSRNTQKLLAENISHGIHGTHRNFWRRISPTESTEHTETSGREEPPIDAYRWLGCVGFCGKIVWWLRGYGRDAIPS